MLKSFLRRKLKNVATLKSMKDKDKNTQIPPRGINSFVHVAFRSLRLKSIRKMSGIQPNYMQILSLKNKQ